MATKRPRRVSQKQLDILEYLIWRSRDADEFSRKALIWLVRQSHGLTKLVRIEEPAIVRDVDKGFHDMCSCNCTTHVDQLFLLAGANLYVRSGGAIGRFDIPLAQHEKLFVSRDQIEAVVPANPYKD